MNKAAILIAVVVGLSACSKSEPEATQSAPSVSAQDQADLKKITGPDKPLELKPIGSKDTSPASPSKGEGDSKR
jgi:hypothetical protein